MVSDLHLRPDAESRDRASALGQFIERLTLSADVRQLVLLGDTFDLPPFVLGAASREQGVERWAAEGRAALSRIASAHVGLTDALRSFTAAGRTLTVVPGNHDLALAQPTVHDALTAVAGDVQLEPWIVHIPGLLYAEHGQQYHEVNAIRTLLQPDPRWGSPGAPAAWAIAALGGPDGPGRAAALRELATAPLRTLVHARGLGAGRSRYRRDLTALGSTIGLRGDALLGIDGLATSSLPHLIARLAVGAVARGGPLEGFSRRLVDVARSIHAILAEHGAAVPLLVFGHSHRPAIVALGSGGSGQAPGRYANAGSWTSLRPARIARLMGPGRYPFLRITEGGEGRAEPTVALALWNAGSGVEEPYPGGAGVDGR